MFNQSCSTRPTFNDLKPYELCFDSLVVSFDRWSGICNTFNNLSEKLFVQNKTENQNVKVFNIISTKNKNKK